MTVEHRRYNKIFLVSVAIVALAAVSFAGIALNDSADGDTALQSPKTDYVIDGMVFKTIHKEGPPVPLPMLYGEGLKTIAVKDWNNRSDLKGEWLSSKKNTVYPGDPGWERVYADFEQKKYEVVLGHIPGVTWNLNGLNRGSSGVFQFDYGTSMIIKASVDPGYTGSPAIFKNGVAYSAGSSFMMTEDVAFTAKGVKMSTGNHQYLEVKLSYMKGVNWTINGEKFGGGGVVSFIKGTSITVNATAGPGYEGTPILFKNGASYNRTAFQLIDNAVFTVSGVHKKNPLEDEGTGNISEVILIAGQGGKVEGAGIYEKSAQVKIRAISDNGFVFVRWSDNNTSPERTIKADAPITLSAIFRDPSQGGGGSNSLIIVGIAAYAICSVIALLWYFRFRTP